MESVNLRSAIENTTNIKRTEQPLPKKSTTQSAAGLEGSIQEVASTAGDGAEIDEEQLQHALTKHILDEIHPEVSEAYSEAFKTAKTGGQSDEDAVKAALQSVVTEGGLSIDEAEKINGLTFRAAQLDNNHEALYDGRGGPNDPTVAKAAIADAVQKAQQTLLAIQNGEESVSARSLEAPSNTAPAASVSHSSGRTSSGSGDFLWKPQSESDGKLVVLLPPQYTGKISSAGIYSSLPPSSANLIEEGRFTGDNHNGGRAHFRFNRDGGSYPDGVYVVATLKSGDQVHFQIDNPASRNS